jgi:hypothetical protein
MYQIPPGISGMPSMRDCVVIIVCHCERTTVRVAIFILSKTYEIASLIIRRGGLQRHCDTVSYAWGVIFSSTYGQY